MGDASTGRAAAMAGDVLAVVVIYRCRPQDSSTLRSLAASCSAAGVRLRTLIYDNGPLVGTTERATAAALPDLALTYVADAGNPGLTRAYNHALARAGDAGQRWLMLLDQDSVLAADFVAVTLASLAARPDVVLHLPLVRARGRTVSPVRLRLGRARGVLPPGHSQPRAFFAVNSGTTVSVDFVAALGGYDEAYRLYGSDNWFCDAAARRGAGVMVTGTTVEHDLARESASPAERLALYAEGARVSRRLYRGRPLLLASFWAWGLAGAVRRAWRHRDTRWLGAFVRGKVA